MSSGKHIYYGESVENVNLLRENSLRSDNRSTFYRINLSIPRLVVLNAISVFSVCTDTRHFGLSIQVYMGLKVRKETCWVVRFTSTPFTRRDVSILVLRDNRSSSLIRLLKLASWLQKRLSTKCRKTKITVITSTNHSQRKEHNKPIRPGSK